MSSVINNILPETNRHVIADGNQSKTRSKRLMKANKEILEDNPYASPNSEDAKLSEEIAEFNGKVYNTLSIAIATIFGSVLAAGLLLHSNYSHFGQQRSALFSVVITALLTIFFLFGMLVMDFPVVLLFLGTNFIIAVFLLPITQVLQGKELEQHELAEREFHSFVRAGLIGVSCSFAMGLMLFFAYILFLMTY